MACAPSRFHLKAFACDESGIIRLLNPDEQESAHPVAEPAESWLVETMRGQILMRARELSLGIPARVLATLQKHPQAEPGQSPTMTFAWAND